MVCAAVVAKSLHTMWPHPDVPVFSLNVHLFLRPVPTRARFSVNLLYHCCPTVGSTHAFAMGISCLVIFSFDFLCGTGSRRSALSTHCCGALFSIYMLALGHLIHRQNIGLHFYTADTQIYLSSRPANSFTEIGCVLNC